MIQLAFLKGGVVKKIVEVEYQCDICKTCYEKECSARACERGKTEPRRFFPGDIVEDKIKYYSGHKPRGPIIRVTRKVLCSKYDPWMVRGFEKYRHIFEYEFRCICDECERRRRGEKAKKYGYIDTDPRPQLSSLLVLVKRKEVKTKNR